MKTINLSFFLPAESPIIFFLFTFEFSFPLKNKKKGKNGFRWGFKARWERIAEKIQLNLCFRSQLNFLLKIYQLVKIDIYCARKHQEIRSFTRLALMPNWNGQKRFSLFYADLTLAMFTFLRLNGNRVWALNDRINEW